MATFLLVLHMFIAIGLIALVLLQRSEGGALGMGGGGPGGLMSGRGAGDVLTRGTQILGAAFITTSIALAIVAGASGDGSVADRVQERLREGESPFPDDLLEGIVSPSANGAAAEAGAEIPLGDADAPAAEAPEDAETLEVPIDD